MPIYTVRCKKCNEEEDILVTSYSDTLPKCKKCGGEVEQILSTFTFKIKGYSYKNKYEGEKQ